MKERWIVTRWVREKTEVWAETREQAMDTVEDPSHVTVIKETCIKAPPDAAEGGE